MYEIFAYLNYNNVHKERHYILELLFNGMRRLEYHGYDSADISIDSALPPLNSAASDFTISPRPLVFRKEGNIESLVKFIYEGFLPFPRGFKFRLMSYYRSLSSWVVVGTGVSEFLRLNFKFLGF